ncbi:MAG: hypothetical protein SFW09_06165 [Hyphomicrobiaceae bacterium]|nr:hypothetical protein [Hyphomicrobiaceae bacterium]
MQRKTRRKLTLRVPIENPAWLSLDPTSEPAPPVRTRRNRLPLLDICWQDFERLTWRLAGARGTVDAAWTYGTPGQAQYGIDILVRLANGDYEVWQSKRYASIKAAQITAAVDIFCRHKWFEKAKRFVLAVACDLTSTAVVEAVEAASRRLKRNRIAFEPLDATRLTLGLKDHPELIDDFFDRAWVREICAPEGLKKLETRFSRFDRASLRRRLRDCYESWTNVVDPGFLLPGQDQRGHLLPAIPLADRYVQPDIILSSTTAVLQPDSARETQWASPSSHETSDVAAYAADPRPRHRDLPSGIAVRTPLDAFILSHGRVAISGPAGAGKSSLLRFLALDILSDSPALDAVRTRLNQHLPIYIPFALWSRLAADLGYAPSLGDVVAKFLQSMGEEALARLSHTR